VATGPLTSPRHVTFNDSVALVSVSWHVIGLAENSPVNLAEVIDTDAVVGPHDVAEPAPIADALAPPPVVRSGGESAASRVTEHVI